MHTDLNRRELRELDQRSTNGLEVTLLWSERTGSLIICVEDRAASVLSQRFVRNIGRGW